MKNRCFVLETLSTVYQKLRKIISKKLLCMFHTMMCSQTVYSKLDLFNIAKLINKHYVNK